jgi:hypothetical protein
MQTVVEIPSYLAAAERLFSPDRLAADPRCGVVIPGSGGIRKVRFGFGSRGKSSGARIIYMFSGESLPVFVVAVFAKNEKANLSAAERNALGKIVANMIESYRRHK